MKKLNIMLCMIACLFGCGGTTVFSEKISKYESEIVNGALYSGHPSVVYVYLGGGSCTGTLISPTIVLTAKHCTEGVATKSIEVMFGNNAYESGEWINAIHYEENPDGYPGGPGDLALITLASPGPATPVPVNTINPDSLIGTQIHIVGFGVTNESGADSGEKRDGWTSLLYVEPGLIYASVNPSSTCYGDSGGPNFIMLDGKEYVLGATSFGTDECGYGLDASARTDDSIDWIKKYIMAHESIAIATAGSCDKDGNCVKGCGEPDPDCPCESDGYCTAACIDMKLDVDCAGCLANGMCQSNCPSLDIDCCETNSICNQSCGNLDTDCFDHPSNNDDLNGGDKKAGTEVIKSKPNNPLIWVGCNSTSGDSNSNFGYLLILGLIFFASIIRIR